METEPTPHADQEPHTGQSDVDADSTTPALIDDELLVEEISIDGMCGVY